MDKCMQFESRAETEIKKANTIPESCYFTSNINRITDIK